MDHHVSLANEPQTIAQPHPFDPLSKAEILRAVAILRAAPGLSGLLRFVSAALREPNKAALAAGNPPREIFMILIDLTERLAYEAIISLNAGSLVSLTPKPGIQPGIVLEEFILCENAVKADPGWQSALARRGITDLDKAIVDPWSAGAYGDEKFPQCRLAQALTWIRGSADDVGYGRPVEGLITYVDLIDMKVVEVIDEGDTPLPPLTGNYTAQSVGPLRSDLKPLDIIQSDGPSFTIDGYHVSWQKWQMRIGFTPREGLVLHEVGYLEDGVLRPIMHRASLSEMQVPYGDPSVTHNKKNVFDVGEYGMGRMTNSLVLGCDCLGVIQYFDAHMLTMAGEVETLKNAICLHEEDAGVMWKHTDWRSNHTEVRRSRRLVVSFFATVGNYDYGFYWYFYQNGDIQMEVKLTGCLSVGALPPGVAPSHGAMVAPQLYAPIHQHFFSFRLDMDIDGAGNSLYEVDTIADPQDAANPYAGCYRPVYTQLTSEAQAARDTNPDTGRTWMIVNPNRLNAVGRPTAYKLIPGADTVKPFAHPSSSLIKRAGFIAHSLWATHYQPAELFVADDYINQNPAPHGIDQWIKRDHSLDNTDIVLWYTLGAHHIPRPEDWPVMPVAHCSFTLKPAGFFNQNPAMDLPPPTPRHSCCD
ncbi:MAG TPA: primary-amine oxidase [Acetobacteraceae bacterium]|nr:primary-amine oxidase [Acetobacteraceae bacterium]